MINKKRGRRFGHIVLEETRRKISIANKNKKLSEETKQKISEGCKKNGIGKWMIGRKHSEEWKTKMSERMKGENHPMYGKHHTEEARRKISEIQEGRKHTEETKRKMSISAKGHIKSEEHRKNLSKSINKGKFQKGYIPWIKGKIHSEKSKKEMGKRRKELWGKSDFVKKQMQSRSVKPNNLELSFQDLLNNFLPNEYKYVGDGKFILGGKCPDFMNVNGQKKLIELFGNYWHKGENPQDRINHFRQFGFDTLVIWEKEIKDNLDIVKEKVVNFNQIK